MPRNGTGWCFDRVEGQQWTVTRSAYCPVCRVKTVEVQGWYDLIFTSDIPGYERLQGCVTAQALCCSEVCLQVYQSRIAQVIGIPQSSRYLILGAFPDAVAESVQRSL